jgi:hypothetical protein
MDHALSLAREEGMDWLMGIDVDEFLAVGSTKQRRGEPVCSPPAHLPSLLARMPSYVDSARMMPQEVEQTAPP